MDHENHRSIWSWCFYDWANSAFATCIIAGFFPIFFKEFWSVGTDPTVSTARLALANSAGGVLVAVMAPFLGAVADRGRFKKKMLGTFAFIGAVMTAALYLVSQGQWITAGWVYMAAMIGYSGGNIFYDSLLVDVAPENRWHVVSAWGFGLGYIGGGLLFAVNVLMTLKPELFGLADAVVAVRISFVMVGIWWAVFTLPLLIFVKQKPVENPLPFIPATGAAIKEIRHTLGRIRQLKPVWIFLIAYWLYIDGVHTIIRMAVDYGISLGFDSSDLITALLMTQFIGFPAAVAFGYLGRKVGARPSLFAGLTVYLGVTIWAFFMNSKLEFYIMAGVIGLVQGGVQALSRSYFAGIIPREHSAEYFGFYNMVGKFATVIGPVLVGGTGLLARQMGVTGTLASRLGILSVSILLISGAILLGKTRPEKSPEI